MATEFAAQFRHGDEEVLDYSFDWKRVLGIDGDAILHSEWVVESGTPAIGNGSNGAPAPSLVPGITTVWVVRGAVGAVYAITNRVQTAFGRTHEASFKILVVDK